MKKTKGLVSLKIIFMYTLSGIFHFLYVSTNFRQFKKSDIFH